VLSEALRTTTEGLEDHDSSESHDENRDDDDRVEHQRYGRWIYREMLMKLETDEQFIPRLWKQPLLVEWYVPDVYSP